MVGAFTGYIDIAQVVLYAFWLFFAGLVFYLHRENNRERYALETERAPGSRVSMRGFPGVPPAKVFHHHDGKDFSVPLYRNDGQIAYMLPWPHARPWRFKVSQPMLRSVPDVRKVASVLVQALVVASPSGEVIVIASVPGPASRRPAAEPAAA